MSSKYVIRADVEPDTGYVFEQILDKLKIKKVDLIKQMIWSTAYEEKIITAQELKNRTTK